MFPVYLLAGFWVERMSCLVLWVVDFGGLHFRFVGCDLLWFGAGLLQVVYFRGCFYFCLLLFVLSCFVLCCVLLD